MSFAEPLIKDLKKRKIQIKNCGYYSLTEEKQVIIRCLQSTRKYDLNIFFGNKVPASEAKFECKLVEIEVFGGLPEIYEKDFNFVVAPNLVVVNYGTRMKREEMKKMKEYLKNLGYSKVRFSKKLFSSDNILYLF